MPAASKALLSFARRIHPQRPLSHRESQQLLGLLQQSFRDHLDHAHPPPPGTPSSSNGVKISKPGPPSGGAAADAHLDSILTHPLFAVSPHARVQPRLSGTVEAAGTIVRKFEQHVASGVADVQVALASLTDLNAHRQMAARTGKTASSPGFAPSTIIRWLMSTHPGQQLYVATDPFAPDFDHLIPSLLVDEGCRELQLEYLFRILSHDGRKRARSILKRTILAYLGHDGSAANALSFYLDVHRRTRQHQIDDQPSLRRELILPSAGVLQAYFLKHRPVSQQLELSYDELVSIVQRLRSPFMLARLHILHPTRPSLQPALGIIEKDMAARASPNTVEAPLHTRRHLVQLGLLTSKVLMEEQRFDEATKILLFLGESYPRELNLPKKVPEAAPGRLERESGQDTLNILDKLAFD